MDARRIPKKHLIFYTSEKDLKALHYWVVRSGIIEIVMIHNFVLTKTFKRSVAYLHREHLKNMLKEL